MKPEGQLELADIKEIGNVIFNTAYHDKKMAEDLKKIIPGLDEFNAKKNEAIEAIHKEYEKSFTAAEWDFGFVKVSFGAVPASTTSIIGGSYGLQLFIGCPFPCAGIDIISSAFHASTNTKYYLTHGLEQEARVIHDVYPPDANIIVRYAYNIDIVRDVDGHAIYHVDDDTRVTYPPLPYITNSNIIGVVTVIRDDMDPINYIFVNVPEHKLVKWYTNYTDLPVFVTFHSKHGAQFVFKDLSNACVAKRSGVLYNITNEDRITKYLNKNFIIKVLKTDDYDDKPNTLFTKFCKRVNNISNIIRGKERYRTYIKTVPTQADVVDNGAPHHESVYSDVLEQVARVNQAESPEYN